MTDFDEQGDPIDCEESQLLMVPVWSGDPDLAERQRTAFESHLAVCPACCKDYEETRRLMSQVRKHWGPISETTQEFVLRESQDGNSRAHNETAWRPLTVDEGWEDLKRRCPSLAEACQRQERQKHRRKLHWRVGGLAAAASVLIAIGIGWLAQWGNDSPNSASCVAGNSSVASAELVTPKGRQPLALNQPVTATDQPQEILLGGMHRVVMNRQSVATIQVDAAKSHDGQMAYAVRLAHGELYVEVVPGHPFTVTTPNACLDITGTKFDVKTERERTELTLLKGSVRFSQANATNEFVNVTVDQASMIEGRSAPTSPCETDALAATAWARELTLGNAIARIQPDADLHLLNSVRDFWPQAPPAALESLDYVTWRDAHRDWFAREFPWTFKVQAVLKEQHGIDADYIDLLMVSGDIWQFNYPRPLNQPIPILNQTTVALTAQHYQIDSAELLAAINSNSASQSSNQSVEEVVKQYHSALERWHSGVAGLITENRDQQSGLLLFTLGTGTYLSNTRTAAWLWLRAHPEAVAMLGQWRDLLSFASGDMDIRQRWLSRLSREIAAADQTSRLSQELITVPAATGCESQATGLSTELAKAAATLSKPEGTP